MEALQEALMNDQRLVMDRLARERNDIDRSKVTLLITNSCHSSGLEARGKGQNGEN